MSSVQSTLLFSSGGFGSHLDSWKPLLLLSPLLSFYPSPSGSKIHSIWTRGSQFIPSPHKSVLVRFTLDPHISRGKHQKPKLLSCLNGLLLMHSFSLCWKPPFPPGLKLGRRWKWSVKGAESFFPALKCSAFFFLVYVYAYSININ